MRKLILILAPAAVVLLIIALLNNPTPHRPTAGQPAGQQAVKYNGVITMLASTVPVDLAVSDRVMDVLTPDAPSRGVFVYAITDITPKNGYLYASVAGLAYGTQAMRLADSVWLGVVQLVDVPGYPGRVIEPAVPGTTLASTSVNTGVGGSGYILPFRSGTQAQYGTSGVHGCGFGLTQWSAVDLFPAEDMIYSSMEGEVNYICRDPTQISLKIGNFLYAHLADTGQQLGDQYTQGQAISGMVHGTFSDTCGVATQGAELYHVHYCFPPTQAGTFTADGYTLSIYTEEWVKDTETVEPLDYLTADWSDAGVTLGPAAGANFYDSTFGGIADMTSHVASALPGHVDMGMANTVIGSAGPAFELMYTVILSNFDLTVPMWCMGIILALETVRILYAGWMWVKKAIPIIG